MIKGLQLTLVTVAVALMGMSAMAEAPVIDEIPSPIVGGGETTTPPNTFVYPDAINLNNYVSDDGGDAGIVWSYEVAGTQIYSINGNDPIDSGSEDPTDPTGKDLNTVRNGEEDPDGVALKITIRNVNLSPLGGTNVDPGSTEGILSSETQVVTLYASDGSTYSQTEVMIYTDNEGEDRLSGISEVGEPVVESIFQPGDPDGYTSSSSIPGSTTVTLDENGICVEVAADGNNLGAWTSPWGYIPLTANAVYRIRAEVNGTQTNPELVPLWDVIIQNFDQLTGANGTYAYFADYYYLGKAGGAYAAGAGMTNVDIYFAPLPAKLPSWNDGSTGAFTATNDPKNDMQMVFRILDADVNAGYGGELDVGEVCIQSFVIDRFDLDTQLTRGTVVHDDAMTEANYFALGLTGQTDITWNTSPDSLTWGPSSTFNNVEIMALTPGDGGDVYAGGDANILFPIPWEDDKIYMIEVDVSAPSAADEVNPVDVIQVGMDGPTWENFMVNSVTRADSTMHNIAMPKAGDPQTYVSFFRSDSASLEGTAAFNRLRARMQILNSDALIYNGMTESDGAFTVHDITVTEVTIP